MCIGLFIRHTRFDGYRGLAIWILYTVALNIGFIWPACYRILSVYMITGHRGGSNDNRFHDALIYTLNRLAIVYIHVSALHTVKLKFTFPLSDWTVAHCQLIIPETVGPSNLRPRYYVLNIIG
jgi:hypothetical protein